MLEARELRVRSPRGRLALDGVTVMAHPGEVIGVLGPDGAGKSTLLRTIAGLERPEAGAITFRGRPLLGLDLRRRVAAGIVYAPEHARILPGLSVLDNLRVGAWLRRDRAAVARDLARVFAWFPALEARRRHRAEALPRATRQVLSLGRALMSGPRVLLLDEPLAGLDANDRLRFAMVAKALQVGEAIILVAERDPSSVRTMADRAYRLQRGRVAASGTPAAVLQARLFAHADE